MDLYEILLIGLEQAYPQFNPKTSCSSEHQKGNYLVLFHFAQIEGEASTDQGLKLEPNAALLFLHLYLGLILT